MNGVIYTNDIYERQNTGMTGGSSPYAGTAAKKPLRLESLGPTNGQNVSQHSAKRSRKKPNDIDVVFAR